MSQKLVDQVMAAFRVSTPLVAINTTDQEATMSQVTGSLSEDTTVVQWDFIRGLMSRNKFSLEKVKELRGNDDESVGNPLIALEKAHDLPKKSVLFVINAHMWIDDAPVRQAIWNLRDQFKRSRRMLVLLAPDVRMAAEILGDTVVLDEPLPDKQQLEAIARSIFEAAKAEAKDDVIERVVEAVQGLPAFQAEQVIAMSMIPGNGVDEDAVWERKRKQIEQTPSLSVNREGVTFDDIGGVEEIKDYLRKIMHGKSKPNAVVMVDEIEKLFAGQNDTSGVSQDQLGQLLCYMQDHNASGLIMVGPPGASKSMVAKATGNEVGIPTISFDPGAAKGSLVGQSEAQFRQALKVISAVSNERSLWIVTCNNISSLPPELKRRFKRGIFFFDLPNADERGAIWKIYEKKFKLPKQKRPSDDGWTGAEIEQCCFTAWDLDVSLVEASTKVVPVAKSAAKQIEALRNMASGTFLSASHPGVYRKKESEYDVVDSERHLAGVE
jgi:hypothetical protein